MFKLSKKFLDQEQNLNLLIFLKQLIVYFILKFLNNSICKRIC